MDGILLTGGKASRLGSLTTVTNKHLLPIYDRPMVLHGIETLKKLGCIRVIIVLGGNSVGDIVNLVRDGSQFGVEVIYKFQHEPKGISDAIRLAQDVLDGPDDDQIHKFLVLLGDNIFGNISFLRKAINDWNGPYFEDDFAVFLHESDHPSDYGQPVVLPDGRIDGFVEKNKTVGHNQIVTGLYGLTSQAFWIIEDQKPSARGELEITDTLSAWKNVRAYDYEGFWSDCGTPEGILAASQYMKEVSWKQLEKVS